MIFSRRKPTQALKVLARMLDRLQRHWSKYLGEENMSSSVYMWLVGWKRRRKEVITGEWAVRKVRLCSILAFFIHQVAIVLLLTRPNLVCQNIILSKIPLNISPTQLTVSRKFEPSDGKVRHRFEGFYSSCAPTQSPDLDHNTNRLSLRSLHFIRDSPKLRRLRNPCP